MSLMMTGISGFLVLFFLILIVRIPIGFSMMVVGLAGMA